MGGKGGVSKFFLIFGSLWIVFAVPMILLGRHIILKEGRYESEGEKGVAKVISKRVHESTDSKKNKSVSYLLKYRFTAPSGKPVEAEDSVNADYFANTPEGKEVPIQYLPASAETDNRVLDGEENDSIGGWLMVGMGSIFCLVGLISLRVFFKRYLLHRKLMREGTLADGTITNIAPGNLSINDVTQYQIHYTYNDHYGKAHKGVSEHMKPELAERWNVGDKGKIRFHKSECEKSIWVG